MANSGSNVPVNYLVIEDNSLDVRLFKETLNDHSSNAFHLVAVDSLKEALELLHAGCEFDLIVLDLDLPDSPDDKLEPLRILQSVVPGTPVVIHSGNENPDVSLAAIKRGAHDFLLKGQTSAWQIVRSLNFAIERKHHYDQLKQVALTDTLTGLGNRRQLYDRLEHAIKRAERNKQIFGLLYIDLDNFKSINDEHGHHVGDEILKMLTPRLKEVTRQSDTLVRYDGDEFVVILENLSEAGDAAEVASKLISKNKDPYRYENSEFHISYSIGIALYPQSGSTADDILKSADAAMYKAKREGKNRFNLDFRADVQKINKSQI